MYREHIRDVRCVIPAELREIKREVVRLGVAVGRISLAVLAIVLAPVIIPVLNLACPRLPKASSL